MGLPLHAMLMVGHRRAMTTSVGGPVPQTRWPSAVLVQQADVVGHVDGQALQDGSLGR
jgi:hypothetical protein